MKPSERIQGLAEEEIRQLADALGPVRFEASKLQCLAVATNRAIVRYLDEQAEGQEQAPLVHTPNCPGCVGRALERNGQGEP